jgi:replication factor A2
LLTVPNQSANHSQDYSGYETSYTSYGAGGGAGGGGFIPGDGSQQSPGNRKDFTQDSLRPVTIKQLLDAQLEPGSNDAFKIDGSLASQVHWTPSMSRTR